MARIGETNCLNPKCKTEGIAVHKSATGKLHSTCHRCGFNEWPVLGTKSHRDLIERTTLDEDDTPKPPPAKAEQQPKPAAHKKAAPTPTPTPTDKKPVNSVFSLSDL